jgi:hypothetical protein
MTIIWFADGARVTQPDNVSRQRDLERWPPSLKPGDLAASDWHTSDRVLELSSRQLPDFEVSTSERGAS